MKGKLHIAVLFGGCSPEYEVSLQSACAVIRHMDRGRFTPVPIGITRQGDWVRFNGGIEEIARDTWNTAKLYPLPPPLVQAPYLLTPPSWCSTGKTARTALCKGCLS